MKSMSILVGALCLAAFADQCAQAQEWPMYQGNEGHTGYVPVMLADSPSGWTTNVQSQFGSSGIAITNGMVVTTPNSGCGGYCPVAANDIATGALLWSINVLQVYSVSWPISDGASIYFQVSHSTLGNYLYSYALNGTLNWYSPFASRFQYYLGPIIVDGNLYFEGGAYGGMYSFNVSNGAQQWYAPLPNYDSSSPTWWNGQLLAYTNRLDIIDAGTGHLLATINDPNSQSVPPKQAPVVVGNLAYVTNGGRLVAFDLVNKSIAWTQAINATGQISTDGSELFVISGGSLTSRDPASGALLWSWTPPAAALISNLIVTKSHVIASNGRQTFLINRASHLVAHSWGSAGDLLAFGEQTLVVASTTSRFVSAIRINQCGDIYSARCPRQ